MKAKLIIGLLIAIIFIFLPSSCVINQFRDLSGESTAGTKDQDTSSNESKEADNNDIEEDPSADMENDETANLSDQIIVTYPVADQLIASPLIITGEARGTWFFETNFPVDLLDSNENVLVRHYAVTEEGWMTEDFISFTATIEFEDPKTATGFIILRKNNPSDIRENDAELIIPVRFENRKIIISKFFKGEEKINFLPL